jgi:hypothetical protein
LNLLENQTQQCLIKRVEKEQPIKTPLPSSNLGDLAEIPYVAETIAQCSIGSPHSHYLCVCNKVST